MVYKTLYLKANPDFEYQRRNGNWFRRKKGSKDDWTRPNANGIKVLNETFKGKPATFFYSKTGLIIGIGIIGVLGYVGYKVFIKKASIL